MIIKFKDLPQIRRKYGDSRIVFAGGTFDILHLGHIKYFKKLKRMGDILVIAVSSNKRVRQRKGPERPILDQKNRLGLLGAIKYIDFVLIGPNPSKQQPYPTCEILEKLKPDLFVSIDRKWCPFRKKIEACGTKMKIIKSQKINSTTNIIKTILNRYCNKKIPNRFVNP